MRKIAPLTGPRARTYRGPGDLARVGFPLLVAVLFTSLGTLICPLPSAAAAAPHLVVSPSVAVPGGTVQVEVSGLIPNQNYQLQICGNDAARGSVDCSLMNAVSWVSTPSGTISTPILVVLPPSPCPCVVAAISPNAGPNVKGPISITGAPQETVTAPPAQPKVVVVDVALSGSTQPKEWLGFAASRTLVLTVRNSGAAPAANLFLTASIGSAPAAVPTLPGLAPGQVRTYRIGVTFPAFTVGNSVLSGHVGVVGWPLTPFHVSLSRYPWGWLIIALIVLQLILLAFRNLARRRVQKNDDRESVPDMPTQETVLADV